MQEAYESLMFFLVERVDTFPMPTNMTWTQLIGAGIALGVLTLLIEAPFRFRIGGGARFLYLILALPLSWWVGAHYAGPALDEIAAPLSPPGPEQQLYDRLATVSEWRERTQGLSRREKDKLILELEGDGFFRLDDESLLALASVLKEDLARVEVPVCADMTRRDQAPAGVRQLVERGGPGTRETWLDLTFKAIVAELKKVEVAQVSEAEAQAAVNALMAQVPTDRQMPLVSILDHPKLRSDEEVCWAGRTMSYYVAALSDRDKRILMRYIFRQRS